VTACGEAVRPGIRFGQCVDEAGISHHFGLWIKVNKKKGTGIKICML